MNKKYERYINYIINDLEIPYFFNMENQYGLRSDEYELVLNKVIGEPISVEGNAIYNQQGKVIYQEDKNGDWSKSEYDNKGNEIYWTNSKGRWFISRYDEHGNQVSYEDNDGKDF